MLRDLKSAVIALVTLTVVFGLALPALFTGFAQVAFSSQAVTATLVGSVSSNCTGRCVFR